MEGGVGDDGDAVADHVEGVDGSLQFITDLAHEVEGLDTEGDDVTNVGNEGLVDGRSLLGFHEVEFDEAKDTVGNGTNKEALKNKEKHYFIIIVVYCFFFNKVRYLYMFFQSNFSLFLFVSVVEH